jgi:hypothetical protein
MRVVKVLLVLGAALLSGTAGYEYADFRNQLIPNRSRILPGDYATRACWDWKLERALIFSVGETTADNGRMERHLSGKATAYDPATAETSPVEESDRLDAYFARLNFPGGISLPDDDPQTIDGRYCARRRPTRWLWRLTERFPRLRQIAIVEQSLYVEAVRDVGRTNSVLVDIAKDAELGMIPDSALDELSQLSFLKSGTSLVNVTRGRIDWYDLADLRSSHRPWLWGIVTPLVVAIGAWVIAAIRRSRMPERRLTSEPAQ